MVEKGTPLQALLHSLTGQLEGKISSACRRENLVKKLLAAYLGVTPLDYVLNPKIELNDQQRGALSDAVRRLNAQEPLQYILSHTYFLGHKVTTTPAALIPRPETEEMVWDLLQSYQGSPPPTHIIDIGTGSGCIALALALAFPDAHVAALDVSRAALELTKKNANAHHVTLDLHLQDLLIEPLPAYPWDLIVSNPPYVPQRESAHIAPHVIDHEPHQALFVPDQAPLCFYERIAGLAQEQLQPKGKICLEIHEDFAQKVLDLFNEKGFVDLVCQEDMQHKPRWIIGHRP